MVRVVGGSSGGFKASDVIAGKPRPRKPASSASSANGSDSSAQTAATKKSALWLPGDDDDLL